MTKILIIDDEPQLRTVLRDILVKEGFAVQDASDGHVGLALWRKDPADLLLTDIFMPNKDGIEIIMELKRSQPQAKIIAMTGGGPSQLMEMGRPQPSWVQTEPLKSPSTGRVSWLRFAASWLRTAIPRDRWLRRFEQRSHRRTN